MTQSAATSEDLGRLTWKVFTRSHGITLQAEAAILLQQLIKDTLPEDRTTLLNHIASSFQKRYSGVALAGRAEIESVVSDIMRRTQVEQGASDTRTFTHVFSAFEQPVFRIENKVYRRVETKAGLLSSCNKIDMLQQRFEAIKLRLSRFPGNMFQGPIQGIKDVKGRDSANTVFVLGMLAQVQEGLFSMEDFDDEMVLAFADESSLSLPEGILCEGCIVIAEGSVNTNIFNAKALHLPPAEYRSHKSTAGLLPSFIDPKADLVLLDRLLQNQSDPSLVVLSEVHLDDYQTMCHLEQLLGSIKPPCLLVLCGQFLKNRMKAGPRLFEVYRTRFAALGRLLSRYMHILGHTKIVLIPSTGETSQLFPVLPFSNALLKCFPNQLDVTFGSNPCRIQFLKFEIVVIRDEMTDRLLRNAIITPRITPLMSVQTVNTILAQAHLSPFATSLRTVMPGLDHFLHLTPLPHLLIIAESLPNYCITRPDCVILNPGCFSDGNARASCVRYSFSSERHEILIL